MAKWTNHVIVVGAGLCGLASALHLRATGRDVTVLERQSSPGGRHGVLEIDGFRFDTGPKLSLTPESLAAPLTAVGEHLDDWIDILPLDPFCRVHHGDGTTLDIPSDPHWRRSVTHRLASIRSLFGLSPAGNGWYPRGGTNAIPRMLAAVAEKHGVSIRYQSKLLEWEERADRIVAARTDDGERLPADAVVLPPTRTGQGRSCLVLHLGSSARYKKIAHHNVHLGDPAILVSSPSLTDPTAAPPGCHVYEIAVPRCGDGPPEREYAGEIMATLEARGYLDLGASLRVSYVVKSGPAESRLGRLHPAFANVVIAGSGLESGSQTAALADTAAASA